MKRVFTYLLSITFIAIVLPKANAQNYTDGPIRLVVQASYFFVNQYHDVVANAEPRWRIWVRDNGNYDGLDWRGGLCVDGPLECVCAGWAGQPGGYSSYWMMDHYYTGTTIPGGFDFRMEAWEEDGCGGNCSYDTGTFCDNDDAHCGPAQIGTNIRYRDMDPVSGTGTIGAPCQWNGANDIVGSWDYFCGGWGAGLRAYWNYTGDVNGTYYWRGQVDGNWYTACNWSTSKVPDSNDPVVIPASGYKFEPSINSGNAYCQNITIQGSTVITINSSNGAVLHITD